MPDPEAAIPHVFDNEQAQRVAALRVARSVMEHRSTAGPLGVAGAVAQAVDPDNLIKVAVYVCDGAAGVLVMEQSRDEQMLRYNASAKAAGL